MSPRVLIMGDINIYVSVDADQLQRQEFKAIISIDNDLKNLENISALNNKFTRFQVIDRPSIIDHILTNLIMAMNQVMTEIVPTKVIQTTKEYLPYVSEEVKEFIDDTNIQLTKAITTKDSNEWRLHKTCKTRNKKSLNSVKRPTLKSSCLA